MKRIYLQAYAHKNLGDDLFVKIICERYPDVKFYISCSKDADDAFEQISNLTIMNRRHLRGMLIQNTKRLMRKLKIDVNFPFDAQVYIGGSIFIEPSEESELETYEREIYAYKVSPNIPYFIIGANFGPHEHLEFLEIHQRFFAREVKDLCFRDVQSYKLFAALSNVRMAPDVVCGVKISEVPKKNKIVLSCIFNDGREGLENFDNEPFIKKSVEVCNKYLQMGKEICLLSMCGEQRDSLTCEAINEQLVKAAEIFYYNGNIEDSLGLFGEAEYVIACRFHAMILAWAAKTPVFPLVYSNKTRQVIEDYGFLGKYSDIGAYQDLDFEDIDANRREEYVFDIGLLAKEAEKQFRALDCFVRGECSD